MKIYVVTEICYFYSPTLDKKYKKEDAYTILKAFDNLSDANKFLESQTIKKFKELSSNGSLKKYLPDNPVDEKEAFLKKHNIVNYSVPSKLIMDFIQAFKLDFYCISETELCSIYS
jgi:hypothetical protein